MNIFLGFLSLFLIFVPKVYSHSGGTDKYGCHGGSKPYHCHNSGSDDNSPKIEVNGWDFNIGYQYQIDESNLSPFLGLSIGKSNHHDEMAFGTNLGLKHLNGWYGGYISTSKSLQLGYKFFHLSGNSDLIGVGISFSFGKLEFNNKFSMYSSGTVFLSSEEESN